MQIQTYDKPGNLATWAADINAAHADAVKHATSAIDYAKQAGELLLKVKQKLPHGAFGAWLEANVEVSERQAQRYMAAAQGKPLPIRHIKSDTVSDLLEEPQAVEPVKSWLPTDPDVLSILIFRHTVPGISDDLQPGPPEHPRLFVQRMSKTDPHWQYEEQTPLYYAAFMEGGQIQYTKCPQPAWLVSYSIGQFAGGRFSKANKMVQALNMKFEDDAALRAHADLGWEYSENSPAFVSGLVDAVHPFNPMEW